MFTCILLCFACSLSLSLSLGHILQILCDIFYLSWILRRMYLISKYLSIFQKLQYPVMVDTSHMWLLGIWNIAIPGKLNFYFMIICFNLNLNTETRKILTVQHSSAVWVEIHFTLTVVSMILYCNVNLGHVYHFQCQNIINTSSLIQSMSEDCFPFNNLPNECCGTL